MRRAAWLLVLPFLLATAARAQGGGALAEVDRLRAAGHFAAAQELLEQQLRQRPGDAALLWRLSRTRVDLGEQAPEDRQKPYYRAAMADAEAAVKADPALAPAHLALAIAAGRVALVSGNKEKVALSRVVKDHVDRAIALDPHDDAALHVRGRWHFEVSRLSGLARAAARLAYGGLPDASFEQAAADFERALAVNDLIRHRVELAKTYARLDREADARAHLERALAMPDADADDPGYKREARALLKALE